MVLPGRAYANAHSDSDRLLVNDDGTFRQGGTDALGGDQGGMAGRFRHDDDELLAAIADDIVHIAHGLTDRGGDELESDVPNEMPVKIVAFLEIVKVNHETRDISPKAARPGT